ncbi:MAG: type II toxin-antitoxin system RelE/ParE family toxin [Myxococcales bacterium]|nr:type II toxin-antitoxin system RelE/ParE family toxin [Myxococcales bacterium]
MPIASRNAPTDKPLVWLHGEVKTPPWSLEARREAGFLLRRLQLGDKLSLPSSRPMPSIGPAVHELRIKDAGAEWRIIYRLDSDAIVIAEVFHKKTQATPHAIIETCKRRLRRYDEAAEQPGEQEAEQMR